MPLPHLDWWPLFKAAHQTHPHHQQPHRPHTHVEKRHIAVPVDDTDQSLKALEWAVNNVYREGDAVHILSVVPQEAGPYPAEVLDSDLPAAPRSDLKAWQSKQRAHESETEALLSLMSHHAANMGVDAGAVHTHPLGAKRCGQCPGQAVVEFVDTAGVDMVVIGSRGLDGWRRKLDEILGGHSVSMYTLMHVRCPVVLVKPEHQLQQAPERQQAKQPPEQGSK